MRASNPSRKSLIGVKAPKTGSSSIATFAAKLRKKWQFAPDAIGMVDGPKDLSRRKGLSG
jgi:hypothetical protein